MGKRPFEKGNIMATFCFFIDAEAASFNGIFYIG